MTRHITTVGAKVARALGWDEIAVTWLDVDEDTAAKIVIVGNRTSDLANYDTAILADILSDLARPAGHGLRPGAIGRAAGRHITARAVLNDGHFGNPVLQRGHLLLRLNDHFDRRYVDAHALPQPPRARNAITHGPRQARKP
ncbi:hypothetical protein [Streptomyces abikoensis]|uniref:hypothetical protein n=1 Tax=Streptomyces abikoensis TaxID=97398 RepID=UPI00167956D7|nr:hypothetical protein [Streptomyces abikoensis]